VLAEQFAVEEAQDGDAVLAEQFAVKGGQLDPAGVTVGEALGDVFAEALGGGVAGSGPCGDELGGAAAEALDGDAVLAEQFAVEGGQLDPAGVTVGEALGDAFAEAPSKRSGAGWPLPRGPWLRRARGARLWRRSGGG
jgi:hypothetical protein